MVVDVTLQMYKADTRKLPRIPNHPNREPQDYDVPKVEISNIGLDEISTEYAEFQSNFLMHVPTTDEYEEIKRLKRSLEELTGRETFVFYKLERVLNKSRNLWEEYVLGAHNLALLHGSSAKNSLSIIRSGVLHSEIEAKKQNEGEELENSPVGTFSELETIAFSINNTEAAYTSDYQAATKGEWSPGPRGILFVLPFKTVTKEGLWYSTVNSTTPGKGIHDIGDELHYLDTTKGISIENAVLLIRSDDQQYWREQLQEAGYSEKWINEHLTTYTDPEGRDDSSYEVVMENSQTRKKLQALEQQDSNPQPIEFKGIYEYPYIEPRLGSNPFVHSPEGGRKILISVPMFGVVGKS